MMLGLAGLSPEAAWTMARIPTRSTSGSSDQVSTSRCSSGAGCGIGAPSAPHSAPARSDAAHKSVPCKALSVLGRGFDSPDQLVAGAAAVRKVPNGLAPDPIETATAGTGPPRAYW